MKNPSNEIEDFSDAPEDFTPRPLRIEMLCMLLFLLLIIAFTADCVLYQLSVNPAI